MRGPQNIGFAEFAEVASRVIVCNSTRPYRFRTTSTSGHCLDPATQRSELSKLPGLSDWPETDR